MDMSLGVMPSNHLHPSPRVTTSLTFLTRDQFHLVLVNDIQMVPDFMVVRIMIF